MACGGAISIRDGAGKITWTYPHLMNEYLSGRVQNRDPWPNAVQLANWTWVGICARELALKGGEIVKLPPFTLA